MYIGGIQKTSLVDFPGNICDTLFFAGCNLRCPYCHNPELVRGDASLTAIGCGEVLAALERRKHLLDGVCISGGEPTLQPVADLVKLLSAIKSLGLQVKLDTNGTKPEVLEQLLERDLIDYVAMDIKAPLERYQEVCRVAVDTDAIKRSVEILRRGLVAYEFRTTVPRSLLSEDDLLQMGQWLQGAVRFVLQAYQPGVHLEPGFVSDEAGVEEWLPAMGEKLQDFFAEVQVRGLKVAVTVG
ncbi:MAG: anaerobic ribonucleoside-triphosphate reductase activating protein [Firmicutes bacterium]|nr:anaerobic ribonucleoside-triphosphate reductase activating protein [Bacillota bacterium]